MRFLPITWITLYFKALDNLVDCNTVHCAITWFIVEAGEDAAVLIVSAAPSPPMLAFLPLPKQQ